MIPVANVLQPLIDLAEAVLLYLHDDVGFGWGMAIVGLTFITRILILPLSIKQIRSMRHLQAHAPEMKALQERYKDDKERLQREMMKFYRENQVNPLASCWPLLLQMPVFLSLFYLLRGDEFSNDVAADPPVGWLFIDNLTESASGAELLILIVLFIGTQIGATLVMTSRINRQQQMLMMLLPLIIVPFIATFPAGLALYWITTNVWTLGQQWVVYTFWPPPDPKEQQELEAAAKPPPPPPRKRKRRR
ncbi:MAG TPA: YidC/Oxa1 family membrane protein insertase [Solirubrobacterales bacterium]|nr:YidC/Oxa1 family membrane protein insertase [Solirubrobacterales bacterium]